MVTKGDNLLNFLEKEMPNNLKKLKKLYGINYCFIMLYCLY